MQPRERHLWRRLILPVLAAVTTIAGTLLAPSKATAVPGGEPAELTISSRVVGKTPQQLRTFWTPERLKRAAENPADAPAILTGEQSATGRGAPSVHDEATRTAFAASVAPANPAAQPPPSLSTQTTVSVSQRVSNVAAWPTSAVGRLFYSSQDGSQWFSCSATSIASSTGNAVWTAAHCLHAGSGGDSGWWANHIFIPAYGLGSNPYGWFFGVSLIAPSDWTSGADVYDSDMGAVIVVPETGSNSLQTTVGAWGYQFDGTTSYTNARSYGYPADGYNRPDSDFAEGEYMMYCEGNTVDAANFNPFDDRLKLDCDMGHGASGGPMAIGIGSSNIQIIGVNSHRDADSNGNFINNWQYSSNHGSTAASVINAVNNS